MCVEVADRENTFFFVVVDARGEPAHDAARDADHSQHQRHRTRELLAIADLILEGEVGKWEGPFWRELAVGVVRAEVGLDRLDRVVGSRLAGRHLSREVKHAGIGRVAQPFFDPGGSSSRGLAAAKRHQDLVEHPQLGCSVAFPTWQLNAAARRLTHSIERVDRGSDQSYGRRFLDYAGIGLLAGAHFVRIRVRRVEPSLIDVALLDRRGKLPGSSIAAPRCVFAKALERPGKAGSDDEIAA